MDQLTSGNTSSLQGNSQSPQSAQTSSQATGSNLQTGASANLLNGSSSISLSNATSSSKTATVVPATTLKTSHKFNSGLLVLPLILVVIALVMIWLAKKAENNTTN